MWDIDIDKVVVIEVQCNRTNTNQVVMHLSFADVDVDIVGSEVIMLWNVMDGQAAQKRNKNISRKRKRGAEKDLYTKCILHYIDGIFTRVSIQVFFHGRRAQCRETAMETL